MERDSSDFPRPHPARLFAYWLLGWPSNRSWHFLLHVQPLRRLMGLPHAAHLVSRA
jgi:hypothetical protein